MVCTFRLPVEHHPYRPLRSARRFPPAGSAGRPGRVRHEAFGSEKDPQSPDWRRQPAAASGEPDRQLRPSRPKSVLRTMEPPKRHDTSAHRQVTCLAP